MTELQEYVHGLGDEMYHDFDETGEWFVTAEDVNEALVVYEETNEFYIETDKLISGEPFGETFVFESDNDEEIIEFIGLFE
jgi:hypothetical protein